VKSIRKTKAFLLLYVTREKGLLFLNPGMGPVMARVHSF
jgi:hypothetical protein